MTISLHGISVSRGIAIGKVHVVKHDQIDVREYKIRQHRIDDEIKRFKDALTHARQQLCMIREHIPDSTNVDIEAFINTHLLMLDDIALTEEPIRLVKRLCCNAEWALKLQRDALVAVFDEMNNAYLRTRKDDVDYVINLIQRVLLNKPPLQHTKPDRRLTGRIIMANDLTPADTVLMQHHGVIAFATAFGGPTSHTAILARSLGLPAIVGLKNALRYIKDDEEIIFDGTRGIVLVDSDGHDLLHYQHLQKEEERYVRRLGKLKNKSAITIDKISIVLHANIELPKDFATVIKVGASGVGLYRTEFLYMNREAPPDEEEHYATYKKVIDILQGLPLTIRTLDLGADKQVDGGRQSASVTPNPALGLRAIRLCLKEPALFLPQLRAIVRVSAHGPVRIMIPMLSNVQEMQQFFQIINNIKTELDELNIPYDHDLKIGATIEVPATAVCADIFAKQLDFLSIGTNDLIQYTMAIDRVNDEVNYLYDPLNLAVLRLIHTIIQAGKKENIPVAMCGEMAGEIKYTRLLLGLGLREFSIHPANLLEVKQIIIDSNISELQVLANRILEAGEGIEMANIMCEKMT